jgi:hypothetical protein
VTDKFVCPECSSQLYVLYRRVVSDRYLIDPATGDVQKQPYSGSVNDDELLIHCTHCRNEVSPPDGEDWIPYFEDGQLYIDVEELEDDE